MPANPRDLVSNGGRLRVTREPDTANADADIGLARRVTGGRIDEAVAEAPAEDARSGRGARAAGLGLVGDGNLNLGVLRKRLCAGEINRAPRKIELPGDARHQFRDAPGSTAPARPAPSSLTPNRVHPLGVSARLRVELHARIPGAKASAFRLLANATICKRKRKGLRANSVAVDGCSQFGANRGTIHQGVMQKNQEFISVLLDTDDLQVDTVITERLAALCLKGCDRYPRIIPEFDTPQLSCGRIGHPQGGHMPAKPLAN
jgi:hypothetical protein